MPTAPFESKPFWPATWVKSPNFIWVDADKNAERILALKEKDDIIEVLRHMLSYGYIAVTLDEDLPGRMIRVSPELYQFLKETLMTGFPDETRKE